MELSHYQSFGEADLIQIAPSREIRLWLAFAIRRRNSNEPLHSSLFTFEEQTQGIGRIRTYSPSVSAGSRSKSLWTSRRLRRLLWLFSPVMNPETAKSRVAIPRQRRIVSWSLHRELSPCCTPSFLLLLREAPSLLDRRNIIRRGLSETFQVQVLDIVSERHLPGFLLMIVQLAELHRVHTQLARHLHLGVGEVMALSRIDPLLHLVVWLSFLRHAISPRFHLFYFIRGRGRPRHPRPRQRTPLPWPTPHRPHRRCPRRRTR